MRNQSMQKHVIINILSVFLAFLMCATMGPWSVPTIAYAQEISAQDVQTENESSDTNQVHPNAADTYEGSSDSALPSAGSNDPNNQSDQNIMVNSNTSQGVVLSQSSQDVPISSVSSDGSNVPPVSASEDQASTVSAESDAGLQGIGASTGGVSITSMTAGGVDAGGTLSLADTSTFDVTIAVGGNDALAGRTVTVEVPDGLQIVSGLGVSSVTNGSMTPAALTSIEQIIWDGAPTYNNSGTKTIDTYSKKWNSGSLVYSLNDGIASGTITLTLRADTKAWDFTNNQSLSPLKVTMSDAAATSVDEKQVGITLNAATPAPTTPSVVASSPLVIGTNGACSIDFTFSNPYGNDQVVKDFTYQMTVPTDSTFKTSDSRLSVTNTVANTDNTTTYTLQARDIWTGIASSSYRFTGSISFPSGSFTAGSVETVSANALSWKTLSLDTNGSLAWVSHTAASGASSTIQLRDPAPFAAAFSGSSGNVQKVYDASLASTTLASSSIKNTSGTATTNPVKFAVTCDTSLDNAASVMLPLPAGSKATEIHYEMTDGSKVTWHDGDTQTQPGTVANNELTISASAGTYVKSAYLIVDQVGTAQSIGSMNVTGLPIATTSTANYSAHTFSFALWDASANAFGNEQSVTNGFRWMPQGAFTLDVTGTDATVTWDYGLNLHLMTLATFTISNTSASTSDGGICADVAIDTTNDDVSTVDIPLPYAASGNNFSMVQQVSWTYEGDSTSYSWDSTSGEASPFTSTTQTSAKLPADSGKYFASVHIVYSSWSKDVGSAKCVLYGMSGGISLDNTNIDLPTMNVRSQNTFSINAYDNGAKGSSFGTTTNGYMWTTQGGSWTQSNGIIKGNAYSSGSEVGEGAQKVLNAGSTGVLSMGIYGSARLSGMTFALVLPNDITPTATSLAIRWGQYRRYVDQSPVGKANFVKSRAATADEALTFGYSGPCTIYYYDFSQQELTTAYDTGTKRAIICVDIPVKVAATAADATYTWSQIGVIGSNVPGYTFANGTLNTLGVGSTNMVRSSSTAEIVVNSDPKLAIHESVAGSDGIGKTDVLVSGADDPAGTASFTKDDVGSMKFDITNTVPSAGITDHISYVFIPVPKAGQTNCNFDMRLASRPTLTTDNASDLGGYEIRYLSTDLPTITSSDASTTFDGASTTFDADCRAIVIKLDHLESDKQVEVKVPISAPSTEQATKIYNRWEAVASYVFQDSSRTQYLAGAATGYLRADYQTYNVDFDTQGGTADPPSQTLGHQVTQPTDPAKNGYTFSGWYTDAECSDANRWDFDTSVSQSMTLYAKWIPISYSVSFDDNAPDATGTMGDQAFTFDSSQKLISNAFSRTGYTFKNWNTAKNGSGTAYNDKAEVSNLSTTNGDKVKLYAQWDAHSYTVAFNANGGTGAAMANEAFTYGTAAALTTNTYTRAGYTFLGWNTDKNATTATYADKASVSDLTDVDGGTVTLYAIWKERGAVIIAYKPSDTIMGETQPTNESLQPATGVATGSTATSKTGYHFVNWTNNKDTTKTTGTVLSAAQVNAVAKATGVYETTTFTANFAGNAYTVAFNANGGAGAAMANEAFTYGTAATLTANTYTRAGYTFLGWDTDANATTATYADNASVSNLTATSGDTVTLYAIWKEAKNVKIAYQPNDTAMGTTQPTNESLQPATGTAKGSTATPKTGYHFVNWTNDKNTTNTTGTVLTAAQVDAVAKATGIYEATTFTANFAGNAYTVAFDANNGTGTAMADEAFTYGTTADLTTNTYTRAGYTFIGWNTDPNATTATYADHENVGNLSDADGATVTLYAIWQEVGAVNLTYQSNDTVMGDTQPANESLQPATGVAAGSTATPKTGYHFVNWTNDKNATKTTGTVLTAAQVDAVAKASGIYEATTFTAHFAGNAYTVAFNVNGGSGTAMADEAFTYGTTADLTTNTYTRAGYTFIGWNTDPNATTATYADQENVGNLSATDGATVTLYAIWQEVGAVNLTYQSNDTVMGDTQPANESLQPATGVAAGSTATPKTGYHFVNWTNDKNATKTTGTVLTAAQVDAVAKASGIYEATTFTADFASNTYNVAFDANGGTGTAMADEAFTYGTSAPLTANTYTRAGYTFLGWDTDANATAATYADNASVSDLTSTDGDAVTLYAIWQELADVTITYRTNDITRGSVSPVDERVSPATGTAMGSQASQKIGYHFVDWSNDTNTIKTVGATLTSSQVDAVAKASGIYEATTFTADFASNTYNVAFDANGGTGTAMADEAFTYGTS
ncbi:MAG: InlB B-repeat-containing protein, partial [Eggerthellaceae bacterium]|nr:InlB B-repeat-containing protein [Eggerthellaceae bacterium]